MAGDVRGRGGGCLAAAALTAAAAAPPSAAPPSAGRVRGEVGVEVAEGGERVEGPALVARRGEAEGEVAAGDAQRRRAQPYAQLAAQRARDARLDRVEQDLAHVGGLSPAEPAHRRAELALERALPRLQPRLQPTDIR